MIKIMATFAGLVMLVLIILAQCVIISVLVLMVLQLKEQIVLQRMHTSVHPVSVDTTKTATHF